MVTEAGNDPKVAGLVYIAAFAPDKGESVEALIKDPPPGAAVPPILPPRKDICSSKGEVPRLLRGGRGRGEGRVHGRFTGAMGGGGA